MLVRGKPAVEAAHGELWALLHDVSPHVSIAAAEALARDGREGDLPDALDRLVALASTRDVFVALPALNALDALDERARAAAARIRTLSPTVHVPHERYATYVPRLLDALKRRWP
jgi:hypothetical protein